VTYAEKTESEILIEQAKIKQKNMAREKAKHLKDLKKELLKIKYYLKKEQSDLTAGQMADILLAATGAVFILRGARGSFKRHDLGNITFGSALFGIGTYSVYRSSVKKEELEQYLTTIEQTMLNMQDKLSAKDIKTLVTEIDKLRKYSDHERDDVSILFKRNAVFVGSVLTITGIFIENSRTFHYHGVTNPISASLSLLIVSLGISNAYAVLSDDLLRQDILENVLLSLNEIAKIEGMIN
jgi:hypothetical protein